MTSLKCKLDHITLMLKFFCRPYYIEKATRGLQRPTGSGPSLAPWPHFLSLSSSFSCFSQNDPFVILRTLMNSYSAPSIWFALLQIYSSFSLTLQERPLSALFKIEITHTHPWHCLSSFLFFLYIYRIYGLLPYYTFYLITFIVVCLLFV